MKKLIMAILVMAGISVTAQDHMNGKRGEMRDLSPEQVATLQTKKMTLALDLNESQQSKIKSMLTEDAKMHKANMEDFKTRKEEGKKMTANEKFEKQNARLDHQITRKKEMKSILSAEQYEKWGKMKHKKKRNQKNKRGDRDKDRRPSRG